MKTIKQYWHDPVWSKVIAGIILAIVGCIASYFLKLWPMIGASFLIGIRYIFSSSSTPNWVLLLLGIISIFAIMVIGAKWGGVKNAQKPISDLSEPIALKPQSPTWFSYKCDSFFDIKWRWVYSSDAKIYNVRAFCPHCDLEVIPHARRPYSLIQIIFYCEGCNRELGTFMESFNSLQKKVIRFIEQKIRNGMG